MVLFIGVRAKSVSTNVYHTPSVPNYKSLWLLIRGSWVLSPTRREYILFIKKYLFPFLKMYNITNLLCWKKRHKPFGTTPKNASMNGAKTEYQQCNGSKAFSYYFIITNALKLIHRRLKSQNCEARRFESQICNFLSYHASMEWYWTKQNKQTKLPFTLPLVFIPFALPLPFVEPNITWWLTDGLKLKLSQDKTPKVCSQSYSQPIESIELTKPAVYFEELSSAAILGCAWTTHEVYHVTQGPNINIILFAELLHQGTCVEWSVPIEGTAWNS